MRKIKSNIFPKIKSQVKTTKTTGTARITFALNASLVQQAENCLNSQWVQQNYTYSSLSELIRKSLQAYRNKEININLTERDKNAPKREITIRFFNADLLNYYYSLPYSQRTAIIEESLRAYLDKLNTKALEKYRKIILAKPKKSKSKPKLTPHFNANFICDNCGDRYEQDTAYSPVRDWIEKRSYITYCSNCVG